MESNFKKIFYSFVVMGTTFSGLFIINAYVLTPTNFRSVAADFQGYMEGHLGHAQLGQVSQAVNTPVVVKPTPTPAFPSPEPDIVPMAIPTESQYHVSHPMKLGTRSPDVIVLQKYLNDNGFRVAESGPGSPGQENNHFGFGTEKAVNQFQEFHREELLTPTGLKKATGFVGPAMIRMINGEN